MVLLSIPTSLIGDHPHACGEHMVWLLMVTLIWGSSPRVWGASNRLRRTSCEQRIIPTRVGSIIMDPLLWRVLWDHPHACGEHLSWQAAFLLLRGIIPTRVGSIRKDGSAQLQHRDHPHACGEHSTFSRSMRAPLGSSPRVWGASSRTRARTRATGIIPTRVGSILRF